MFISDQKLRQTSPAQLMNQALSPALSNLLRACTQNNHQLTIKLSDLVFSIDENDDPNRPVSRADLDTAAQVMGLSQGATIGRHDPRDERFIGLEQDDFRTVISSYIKKQYPEANIHHRRFLKAIIEGCQNNQDLTVAQLLEGIDDEIESKSLIEEDDEARGNSQADSNNLHRPRDLTTAEQFDFNDPDTWDDVLDERISMTELHQALRDDEKP